MTIQGFLASLTLDGNDISQQVATTPLDRTKGLLSKAVMDGSGVAQSIPGVESGTLAVSGFLSQAEHNAMELTWAKDVPVAFVLEVEEGLTTDALWTGLVTLTSFTVNPQEDGLWEFSISGDTSGATVYTPSAP
jgi:hypothetical protein